MVFRFSRKKYRAQQNEQKRNQQLADVIKEVYRKHQLLKELEETAYEVPEELYMLRKVEGAKYLYLMKEARRRNISSDIALPKKARNTMLKKRGYQKEKLFSDK